MWQWKFRSKMLSEVIACLCFFSGSAHANCWYDNSLSAHASQVARQHFPRIRQLPSMVVCSAEDFSQGIGGSFTSGHTPEIRIPVWQLHRSELTTVLGHELAHYQSFLDGTADGTANGHGTGWMSVMLAAGFHDEAHRVAATVPGAGQALAQVQGYRERRVPRERPQAQIESPPPQYANPQIVTCFLQPQQAIFRDRSGWQYVSTFFVQVCRTD